MSSRWSEVASYLLASEASSEWSKTHTSYSSWLAGLATQVGRSEATLWRALAAGRYYNKLRAEFSLTGLDLPELGSRDLLASPESLELLEKISRAAPSEVFQEIAPKVVTAKIARSELRAYWENYRPVLKGLTARGKNVIAPRYDEDDIEMQSARVAANCVAGLIKHGSEWLGCANAYIYKAISTIDASALKLSCAFIPGTIVIYQLDDKLPIQVHGIQIANSPDKDPTLQRYKECGLGVDHLWVVTHSHKSSKFIGACSEVGIICSDQSRVNVIRPALKARENAAEKVAVLKGLLSHETLA